MDPDESLEELVADAARSEARAAQMPAFEQALARVRGRASSMERDIVVEVDSTGRVLDLRIAEQALARGARRLTHSIVTTIRAAETDAGARTRSALRELLGDDDPILAQLDAAASER